MIKELSRVVMESSEVNEDVLLALFLTSTSNMRNQIIDAKIGRHNLELQIITDSEKKRQHS